MHYTNGERIMYHACVELTTVHCMLMGDCSSALHALGLCWVLALGATLPEDAGGPFQNGQGMLLMNITCLPQTRG